MAYAIKVAVSDLAASMFTFEAQKTMYGGRRIAAGDVLYLFDSENHGGVGLFARGVVTAARPTPPVPGVARQTPRVSIEVRRTGSARHPLGRRELRGFAAWDDGQPQAELNFKLYRQATDKIVGVSDDASAFLDRCFEGR